jgi:hypothetical protein
MLGEVFQDIRNGVPPAIRPTDLTMEDSTLWDILESCWCLDPAKRPNASFILEQLRGHIIGRRHSLEARATPLGYSNPITNLSGGSNHPRNETTYPVPRSVFSSISDSLISLVARSAASLQSYRHIRLTPYHDTVASNEPPASLAIGPTHLSRSTEEELDERRDTRYHVSYNGSSYSLIPISKTSAPQETVFNSEQLTAAQEILRFYRSHLCGAIPDRLFAEEIVYRLGDQKICLLGDCGSEWKAGRYSKAHHDLARLESIGASIGMPEKHLYDHIVLDHFKCYHFRCDEWYVLPSFPARALIMSEIYLTYNSFLKSSTSMAEFTQDEDFVAHELGHGHDIGGVRTPDGIMCKSCDVTYHLNEFYRHLC